MTDSQDKKQQRRARQHAAVREEIKAMARDHIARDGAAALSLRAVASDLGLSSAGIYYYYPNRDALITDLIIEAYTSFGDSQLAARDSFPANDLDGRLEAIGLAYRAWAHTYPQRYQLIFEAVIPGYQPPHEQIHPAGARAMSALVSVVEAFRRAGRLRVEAFPHLTPASATVIALQETYGGTIDILSFSIALYVWSFVHGMVSLELAGNLPPFGPSGDELYRYGLDLIAQQLFKEE